MSQSSRRRGGNGKPGRCYRFLPSLARSRTYLGSQSSATTTNGTHNKPETSYVGLQDGGCRNGGFVRWNGKCRSTNGKGNSRTRRLCRRRRRATFISHSFTTSQAVSFSLPTGWSRYTACRLSRPTKNANSGRCSGTNNRWRKFRCCKTWRTSRRQEFTFCHLSVPADFCQTGSSLTKVCRKNINTIRRFHPVRKTDCNRFMTFGMALCGTDEGKSGSEGRLAGRSRGCRRS